MHLRRTTVIAVGGVALVCAVLVAAVVIVLAPRFDERANTDAQPAASWAPPGRPPVGANRGGRGITTKVDLHWAAATALATGIPQRALLAYAGAAIVKAKAMPSCALSWTTLAAIGEVESDHGRHGRSSIGPDGTVSPPIYGVALDGNGTVLVPDSDGGTIDGDPSSDRAVGPMQLIPQTWGNWHVDGNGDFIEDPQNIDDAVLATTNYLCRTSTALDTEVGWRAAIAAYNPAPSYLAEVARVALLYNRLSTN